MPPMKQRIRNAEELAWFLNHTQRFQGGHVIDLHVQKRRLFDEGTGREITAGTQMTAVIRYNISPLGLEGGYGITRVARLNMMGVTDFSIFEQEGSDYSEIGIIHAEASRGRLRFWFDPQGELYVICEEAELEEVSMPGQWSTIPSGISNWTFQAHSGDLPEIDWFLKHLDQAGLPCAWRGGKRAVNGHPAIRWEGDLLSASLHEDSDCSLVHIQTYGPLDGSGFGVTLRTCVPQRIEAVKVLRALADLVARNFDGTCLTGRRVMERGEWCHASDMHSLPWWEASYGCGEGFWQGR